MGPQQVAETSHTFDDKHKSMRVSSPPFGISACCFHSYMVAGWMHGSAPPKRWRLASQALFVACVGEASISTLRMHGIRHIWGDLDRAYISTSGSGATFYPRSPVTYATLHTSQSNRQHKGRHASRAATYAPPQGHHPEYTTYPHTSIGTRFSHCIPQRTPHGPAIAAAPHHPANVGAT